MSALRDLGTAQDGTRVQAAVLERPGGLRAEVWTQGARLGSLSAPLGDGGRAELLQAPADLLAAEADDAFHDVVIGPVANRIAGARFTVDGRTFQLQPNEGPNLLHSGAIGWSAAPWRFAALEPHRCVLEHDAPTAGGYPADVRARVIVSLPTDDVLEIVWEAEVSAPAPVAMTHHLYFNLSAGLEREVTGHELQVAAAAFTPVGPGLIPTGELRPVDGGPFDLRRPRRIAEVIAGPDPQLALGGGGLDLNWALDGHAPEALALRSPATGLELHVATDQPGLQLYTGQTLKPPWPRFGALAVEPQDFPDAVNRPGFPPVVVRPGAPYRRWARYRVAAGAPGPRV